MYRWKSPGKISSAFFNDRTNKIKLLIGPTGTGKTTTSYADMLARANDQPACLPRNDNEPPTRFTRWLVVRESRQHLEETAFRTFINIVSCMPQEFYQTVGKEAVILHYPRSDPTTGELDGTWVHSEFIFRRMTKGDESALKSLEITGCYFNECQYQSLEFIQEATTRALAGRYPPKDWFPADLDEYERTQNTCIIMDTNPPDAITNWVCTEEERFRKELPTFATVYKQPSMEDPDAENLSNLAHDYLQTSKKALSPEKYQRLVCCNFMYETQDDSVYYRHFKRNVHVSELPLVYRGGDLVVGLDFGMKPAAAFCEVSGTEIRVLEEYAPPVTRNVLLKEFCEEIGSTIKRLAHGRPVNVQYWGDPSGAHSTTEGRSTIDWFQMNGYDVQVTYTNTPSIRVDTVAQALKARYKPDINTGLVISINCSTLVNGFQGGYVYEKYRDKHHQSLSNKIMKNKYSHVHDALQYAMLGIESAGYLQNGYTKLPDEYRHVSASSLKPEDEYTVDQSFHNSLGI